MFGGFDEAGERVVGEVALIFDLMGLDYDMGFDFGGRDYGSCVIESNFILQDSYFCCSANG